MPMQNILATNAKKIVMSGPSGFLGSRVLDQLLQLHELRKLNNVPPGQIILLSSSPGTLMERLYNKYGTEKMRGVRASRVDYFTQHDVETWIDHLGSLGLGGHDSVFVNLAAVAGPMTNISDAMMDVNYKAPIAAAHACQRLGFGHWIQSSTQATNAARGGQISYSRAKGMMDFALSRMADMPITVACLGLLYCKTDGIIGQEGTTKLNMIDLTLLPLTPIMGDGSAPLQPQEVTDAAERLAVLALTDPDTRPMQTSKFSKKSNEFSNANTHDQQDPSMDDAYHAYFTPPKYCTLATFRFYDAVGPETMTMLEMLSKFAKFQGNNNFRPVNVGYRNMEMILNVKSIGNLNRQFVSLLRSEQDSSNPIIGVPDAWESVLLRVDKKLTRVDEAFSLNLIPLNEVKQRKFPYMTTLRWIYNNPGVIKPGLFLTYEILNSFMKSKKL